jgi:hypothetical protein
MSDDANQSVLDWISMLTGAIKAGKKNGKKVTAMDAFKLAVEAKIPIKSVSFTKTNKVKLKMRRKQ